MEMEPANAEDSVAKALRYRDQLVRNRTQSRGIHGVVEEDEGDGHHCLPELHGSNSFQVVEDASSAARRGRRGGHDGGRGKRPTTQSISSAPSSAARGGRPRKAPYKQPRPSSSGAATGVTASADNLCAEGFVDSETCNGSGMKEFDKAEWSTTNTRIFCELCVEQIEAGNRPIGIMTTRGYQNIAVKYLQKTGLRHSKMQLKNRWDILKALYSFWLGLLKDTGLGWDSTQGTVSASDKYWKQVTKGHSEWKKLQHGPPDCEDLLSQMFAEVAVDGSSACAPGEDVGGAGVQSLDDTPVDISLHRYTTNNKSVKRGCITTENSPLKKVKNPMVKVMKNIQSTLDTNCSIANKVMQGEFRYNSIKEVMDLVVECGAAEGSAEHFMATQLFVKSFHIVTCSRLLPPRREGSVG